MTTNMGAAPRILIVDDDAQILNIVRKLLEAEGYDVHAVASGDLAMGNIDNDAPDLVITDIFMPDGDGLEILNMIRERSPDLPVIVMSGSQPSGDANYLDIAGRLGAVQSLAKPFMSAQLLEAVKSALSRK